MSETARQHPSLEAARLIRGRALIAKGDAAQGLKDIQGVAASNPASEQAQYYLAQAFLVLGRTGEARAAYEAALKLDPSLVSARAELAALDGRPPGEAERRRIAELQVAIEREPKNVELREALVRMLLLQHDVPRAQEEIDRILAVAPLHVGANFLAARIALDQGKPDRALSSLEALARTNPTHVEANLLLARLYESRGRQPDAAARLEAVLAADPGRIDARYRLGQLYAQAGRLDEAMAAALELERLGPGKAEPALLKGRVLLEQRKPAAAVASLESAVRMRPDLPEAHRWLGQAYQALNQTDRARTSYEKALALDASDVIALNNLAWILAEVRRMPAEALPFAKKAATIAPRSPEVLDTLGWIHYRLGAFAEAEKALSEAVERGPASATAHYHLGLTYQRLGKKSDAVSVLRRAAQLDPSLAEAHKLDAVIKELGG
jgi:tetratricopeptide (TPR) repeat protein